MSSFKALSSGLLRVLRYPMLILFVYLAVLVLALPLGLAVQSSIRDSVDDSLVHEKLRQGFDMSWYSEFSFENRDGLTATFGPSVVGGVVPWVNLERLLDGKLFDLNPAIVAAGIAYLLFWAFIAGGLLDRFANLPRVDLRPRFFAQSGVCFARLLRLLLLSVAIYLALFKWGVGPLHEWLKDVTRDVTSETLVLLATALIYAGIGVVLLLLSMIFDYAKIAIVVEGRTSALLAIVRGLRFVLSNPGRTTALYTLLLLLGTILLGVYTLAAPGPGQSGPTAILLAFLAGQLYLAVRLVLKLWFLASQTVLFQEHAAGARKA